MYKLNVMNIFFLKEVLSIPSISGNESMVRDYIIEYAKKNSIEYYTDARGNLYLTKGSDKMTSGEYYPCVVSHMDTVHGSHRELIETKTNLIIESINDSENSDGLSTLIAKHPITKEQTGIGGDDKCGVYVCLEMFERFDVLKGAFFVEEEIGMLGSRVADDKFFENVGYAIQFDAPSSNWISEICSGVKLFDEDFKEEIKGTLNECGYTKFSVDPYTDVNQLAKKYDFNCLNLGCGYYRQHTNSEYVVVAEVFDAVKAGYELIKKLGIEKYTHKKIQEKTLISETNYSQDTYNDYEYDFDDYYIEDEFDELAESISNLVIDMYSNGVSEEEIKQELSDYLRNL